MFLAIANTLAPPPGGIDHDRVIAVAAGSCGASRSAAQMHQERAIADLPITTRVPRRIASDRRSAMLGVARRHTSRRSAVAHVQRPSHQAQ